LGADSLAGPLEERRAVPLLVVVPAALSFLHFRSGWVAAGSVWPLLYVLLALALSAYSAVVLTLYSNRKPPRA